MEVIVMYTDFAYEFFSQNPRLIAASIRHMPLASALMKFYHIDTIET